MKTSMSKWIREGLAMVVTVLLAMFSGCGKGQPVSAPEEAEAATPQDVEPVQQDSTPLDTPPPSIEINHPAQGDDATISEERGSRGIIALETRWEDGVLTMPCTVNGLRLRFIFDTGASSVCISSTEALFMLKNGYLDEADIGGPIQSVIANGDIVDSTEITLREVEVGGIVLKDVRAIVTHGLDAPLLFGQSAIRKLGTIQIQDDQVTIIPGTGVGIVGNAPTRDNLDTYDSDEYKRRGWLVERDGGWFLADDAPMDAKLCFYRSEALQWKDTAKMVKLGELYATGIGVPQDFAESFKWYRMAAENGDAAGQFYTGVYYNEGKGVRQDKAEARRWYAMAAAQGDVTAQFNLGIMFKVGEGGREDKYEAANWFRRAAEQGYPNAQLNLGYMYYNGEGIAKNIQQAIYWYRKASKQGNAIALCNLGLIYEDGIGVDKNTSAALSLYKKAADIGNDLAEKNYRRLLREKKEHDRRVKGY